MKSNTKEPSAGEVKRAAIDARLELLATENGGRLTPELVLSDAVDPSSPLHDRFEWDDAKAAAEHRLDQARALIRGVRVQVTTEHRKVISVAYVRDPGAGSDQGYISIMKVKRSREKALEVVHYEAIRARAAMQRARDVSEVLGLQEHVDEVLDRIVRLQETLPGE